ncbi:hypothetical protein [Mycolicibacterium elephantis]|uniref:SMODS and SLOG-associating 2TM effector domain-containing protein n=1 Tax=Mycolicibacterium elephantis DSM 44368 TaxID=1335622 RepID=A0A439E0P4_9MYCO|nr:hypothetical protein [Mycolicibacterium elephantis]MCV7221543.1 hypothetical protein [Mycolicibacterium elephantis]RWA23982.1 hypothetical protein MELE44368_01870 [Mycolicibacterium elephantis DSM 44368]
MSGVAGESPAESTPSVFSNHVRYVLDREFERADRSNGRAGTIFKAQIAILTVAIGVIAIVYRDGHGLMLDVATAGIFGVAAFIAVVALLAAAFGQSIAVKSTLTDEQTFDKMLSPEHWYADANALYVTACRDRDSVIELRKSNDKRALVTDIALWCQVVSVILAVAAIGHEVASRLGYV